MEDIYVLIQFGELTFWTYDYKEVMFEAKNVVCQHICDHLWHKLPLKITPEIAKDFDIRIFKISNDCGVELPYQEWADEYYQDIVENNKIEEEREYKQFLELYERYKDRIQECK